MNNKTNKTDQIKTVKETAENHAQIINKDILICEENQQMEDQSGTAEKDIKLSETEVLNIILWLGLGAYMFNNMGILEIICKKAFKHLKII